MSCVLTQFAFCVSIKQIIHQTQKTQLRFLLTKQHFLNVKFSVMDHDSEANKHCRTKGAEEKKTHNYLSHVSVPHDFTANVYFP